MKQQMISPNDLQPNSFNPNVVDAENEKRIEESMKRLGFFRPIVVRELEDGSLEILGGEHRWRKAIELGYTEVPIINVGVISDEKAKEICLADNARYGHDDTLKMADLIKSLGGPDDLQQFLPLTEDDLASIFAAQSIALDDLDKLSAPPESPTAPEKAGPTHQIMRFKVPVEDVAWITTFVEQTMKREGFIGEDSLMNAGNAFVFLIKKLKDAS